MIKRSPLSSPPPQTLSRAEMIAELRLLVGGRPLRQCQSDWDVDFREISAVLREKQYPGERLLAVMGLREDSDVRYIRINTNGRSVSK